MTSRSRIHLNLFLSTTGHHEASWRFPSAQPERIGDVRYYQEMAATAERGKLDSVFLGDHLALASVNYRAEGRFDPLILLSALATTTTHIGLIGTASTTYSEPYNLARQFASLDHLSRGRAGWNMVTTWVADVAANYGLPKPLPHADRYARANEYLEVVTKLWDSWEDDAHVIDRATGVYVDPTRVHAIEHAGTYFKVHGALNVPRSPQGRPVLVQAGSSDDGRAFAAKYAEAIFTAQRELAEAQAFYADMKRRVTEYGRDPNAVLILPGLSAIVGSTTAEARAIQEQLDQLTVPALGVSALSSIFDGADFSAVALDEPVSLDVFPDPGKLVNSQSRAQLIVDLVRRERLTLRALLRRLAHARGHRTVVGTPEEIVEQMLDWVEHDAADGFNLVPPYLPQGLTDFVDQVIPILQKRGVFRREYEGTTLRDHYGLPRPASRFAGPIVR
jgi:FMN-dependent oxidoreductase (nitrilotriacetate monooxygenase family)